MLLRAIAPLDTVRDVFRKTAVGQPKEFQPAIIRRAADSSERDTLTLNVCPEDWDALSVQLQATPGRLIGDDDCYRNNHLSDAIWLSDHNGSDLQTSLPDFDLFLHREA